jgi:hypothetical protein
LACLRDVLTVLATVYSLRNVLICNLIKASNLESESLAEEASHALARSTGRFVTVTALWVIFQSVSVYTFEWTSKSGTRFMFYASSGDNMQESGYGVLGVFVLSVPVGASTSPRLVWQFDSRHMPDWRLRN